MRANRKLAAKGSKGDAAAAGRHHEVYGMIFLAAAVVVLLSLLSFDPLDPIFEGAGHKAHNLVGLVGAHLADGLLYALGVMAFLIAGALTYAAALAFTRGGLRLGPGKAIGYPILILLGSALTHIALSGRSLLGHAPGGLLGEVAGGLFVSLLSTAGSIAVLLAGLAITLIVVAGFSPARTGVLLGRGVGFLGCTLGRALVWLGRHSAELSWRASRALGRYLVAQAREFAETLRQRPAPQVALATAAAESGIELGPQEPEIEIPARRGRPGTRGVLLAPPVSLPPLSERREPEVITTEPPALNPADEPATDSETEERAKPPRGFRDIRRDQEPEIVMPRLENREVEEKRPREESKAVPSIDYRNYQLPDIDLLNYEEQPETEIDKDRLTEYARRLEGKLADYGIDGRVAKIMPGPVVTMYEYAPGPGVKVAKIANLSNDLALALEAMSVRIIAPIPGRAVVGIEVSNKDRCTVFAKEIVAHKAFSSSRSKLTMVLGKNIEGAPYVADLNKMPHLLVAGATGTGKSVALNAMITSILYKATPEDVRFIMVDPKVLELSLYEGIPHLLLPVVTDPRKAQAALQWAVNEMERRIQILHTAGVRNLDGYNRKVEEWQQRPGQAKPAPEPAGEPGHLTPPAPVRRKKILVIDKTAATAEQEIQQIEVRETPPAAEPSAPPAPASDGVLGPDPRKLPHIVIVIDELADLMMTASREVETNIARIAQKARAAGIHLIVATQRPSVNVITGLIKANLPARISFRVASKVDSRTILDANGADALLGNGDMLFHPPTSSQLVRVHGALITEEEITRVVEHLKKQAEPVYDESILASAEEEENPEDGAEDDFSDELYDMAVQIVAEMGQASTSMVQRKLRIGYNRAARLIERMEREGIVGPPDGARPRQVLIQHHPD